MRNISPNVYYVYYYLRSVDSPNGKAGTPYYVGKGKGNRINRSHGRLARPKDKNNRVKIIECLSEAVAHQIEILHIAIWGRLDLGTGCLRNKTRGGQGCSGFVFSEEQRKLRGERLKQVLATPEAKRKRSRIMKKAQNQPETNAKRSLSLKKFNAATSSLERSIRQKIVQNNPSTNAKRSQSLRRANKNPEVIQRRREAQLVPEVAAKRAALEADPQYKAQKSRLAREAAYRPETKEKRRLARQAYLADPKNRMPCEHCHKLCLKSDYVKNHGRNCKVLNSL